MTTLGIGVGGFLMRFKIEGVDAETGKKVAPIIVEADSESTAANRAKHQGLIATKVQEYTEPPKATPYLPPHAEGPSLLTAPALFVIGVLIFIIGFSEKSPTSPICGSIFIVGSFIVNAVNNFHRALLRK